MDGHALAALVLAHVQRFFSAARRAVGGVRSDETASLVALGGNLLWAHSAFVGAPKEQERAMAVVGAAAGTLAGGLADDDPGADRPFDQLERALLLGLDPLVERLAAKLQAEGPAEGSPGTVARWVWEQLFPGYPWAVGQGELEAAIRARLS